MRDQLQKGASRTGMGGASEGGARTRDQRAAGSGERDGPPPMMQRGRSARQDLEGLDLIERELDIVQHDGERRSEHAVLVMSAPRLRIAAPRPQGSRADQRRPTAALRARRPLRGKELQACRDPPRRTRPLHPRRSHRATSRRRARSPRASSHRPARRSQPRSHRALGLMGARANGATSRFTYDAHALALTSTTDPLGNTTSEPE